MPCTRSCMSVASSFPCRDLLSRASSPDVRCPLNRSKSRAAPAPYARATCSPLGKARTRVGLAPPLGSPRRTPEFAGGPAQNRSIIEARVDGTAHVRERPAEVANEAHLAWRQRQGSRARGGGGRMEGSRCALAGHRATGAHEAHRRRPSASVRRHLSRQCPATITSPQRVASRESVT